LKIQSTLFLTKRRIFTNHEILVEAPTVIYLTTDGFADQPSPDGLKYGTRRLKELLALNAHLPALSQFQKLTNELNRHQAQ
jgi:serine phosphatase RsbU (regulator of sigma subunit)